MRERRMDKGVSRRRFLNTAAIASGLGLSGVIGGMSYVAMQGSEGKSGKYFVEASAAPMPGMDMGAGQPSSMTWQEMDAAHKKGVEQFLQNQQTPLTKGKGNQPLQYTLDGGVKVFDLTVDEVDWEVSPGSVQKALGYNGMVPGPIIRATEGDRVRINFKNNLSESTLIHWHGLRVPNNMDGVPFVTQDPVQPGGSLTYEFTLRNSGTHMYHSHHNSLNQVNRGLLGAFIVDPKDPKSYPAYDREYVMVLNDLNLGFTINGKGFPATDAVVAKQGERVLIRFLNEGTMNHPMHLHGMPMQIIAKDGYALANPQYCDTIDVAPGNRYDALVVADEPGAWAFHCHILSHAEGENGMFGLVTAMIVT